jgi:hypothetical protein
MGVEVGVGSGVEVGGTGVSDGCGREVGVSVDTGTGVCMQLEVIINKTIRNGIAGNRFMLPQHPL